jgi:hypothetical protein
MRPSARSLSRSLVAGRGVEIRKKEESMRVRRMKS